MESKNQITMVDSRLQLEIYGLQLNGKPIIIYELTPEIFYNTWGKFREVFSAEKSNVELVNEVPGAIIEILPLATNITPADFPFLKKLGFSSFRQILNAFLEVNSDFLWMSDSVGVTKMAKNLVAAGKEEAERKLGEILAKFWESLSPEPGQTAA